ncbi:uncharacterized protein LOC132951218 [Metopolophium dirhodum]|uniref:uncharacterized protein LOC132951218 n=1 Tax=Metopolophium dirhodum TaxID=44670 RepID=UPI00298FD5C7|nr:uncharacterized protein LOC132951218 [Metopolophium dirhodum]
MTFELLPQNTAIPSTVISSNMSQVDSSSIVNNLFSSCSSGSDSAFNIHQEKVNNYNFSEIQNCNISDTLLTPNFKETFNNSRTNICDKLRYWILQYKVSHNGVDSLLSILRSEGIKVPKDVRTLMNTPKTKEITNITNGSYIHLGLKNMLLPLLKINNANIHITNKELEVGINIDGLPIARSSKSQLWPILISILNCNNLLSKIVIPIGIFHGYKKPHSIEEYLNPFIDDILDALRSGLDVNGTKMNLKISNIVCDAPAKSFLLNVKYFNAYFGCSSCTEEGEYLENRVVSTGTNASLRTDESFRNNSNEEYYKGDTPLLRLPINITDVVCLDYMHCICLGVTKRLTEFWVRGKKNIRLTDDQKQCINNELKILRSYVPSEFCRLPRPLDDVDFWKATELRSFVLYSGVIVLKGKLKSEFYKHFLLLVFATRLLISAHLDLKITYST